LAIVAHYIMTHDCSRWLVVKLDCFRSNKQKINESYVLRDKNKQNGPIIRKKIVVNSFRSAWVIVPNAMQEVPTCSASRPVDLFLEKPAKRLFQPLSCQVFWRYSTTVSFNLVFHISIVSKLFNNTFDGFVLWDCCIWVETYDLVSKMSIRWGIEKLFNIVVESSMEKTTLNLILSVIWKLEKEDHINQIMTAIWKVQNHFRPPCKCSF